MTGKKKTVLIVDDEQDVVDFLSMALDDAGFSTVTAGDGVEALERMQESVPDVISLDVVMPKGSGIKFYRELKKKKEWAEIPVIIVTGHARDEMGGADFNEMTISGPGVYLEKPVTAKSYIHAIKSALDLVNGDIADSVDGMKDEIRSYIENADPATLDEVARFIRSKNRS